MGLEDEEGERGRLWKMQCWPGVCYSSIECVLSTYCVSALLQALGRRSVHSRGPALLGLTFCEGSVGREVTAGCCSRGAVRAASLSRGHLSRALEQVREP